MAAGAPAPAACPRAVAARLRPRPRHVIKTSACPEEPSQRRDGGRRISLAASQPLLFGNYWHAAHGGSARPVRRAGSRYCSGGMAGMFRVGIIGFGGAGIGQLAYFSCIPDCKVEKVFD